MPCRKSVGERHMWIEFGKSPLSSFHIEAAIENGAKGLDDLDHVAVLRREAERTDAALLQRGDIVQEIRAGMR